MTDQKYILDDEHNLVPADLLTWARWVEKSDRVVGKDTVGDQKVSTVFLGLDQSFGAGVPLYFETMVFGGKNDQHMERYDTWLHAKEGHDRIVEDVRKGKEL